MHPLLLQDWLALGCTARVTSVAQDQADWLKMGPFFDIMFWLDVRKLTTGGGRVSMSYEIAPVEDDTSFTSLVPPVPMTCASAPTRTLALLGGSARSEPTWLRWRLNVSGATTRWDTTFRIWLAANHSE